MKQLFIPLLVVVAGAGVYYFLQNKKNDITSSVDNPRNPYNPCNPCSRV